jgi:hypothetical protein
VNRCDGSSRPSDRSTASTISGKLPIIDPDASTT